jgi:hypothetical protein
MAKRRNKVNIQARDQLGNRGMLIGVAGVRLFESQQSISTRTRSGGYSVLASGVFAEDRYHVVWLI